MNNSILDIILYYMLTRTGDLLNKKMTMFSIGQYTENNKRQRIPKGQSKMDIPEKLATPVRQDEEKQNKNTTQYVLDTTKSILRKI